jgi:hypothetical protein
VKNFGLKPEVSSFLIGKDFPDSEMKLGFASFLVG